MLVRLVLAGRLAALHPEDEQDDDQDRERDQADEAQQRRQVRRRARRSLRSARAVLRTGASAAPSADVSCGRRLVLEEVEIDVVCRARSSAVLQEKVGSLYLVRRTAQDSAGRAKSKEVVAEAALAALSERARPRALSAPAPARQRRLGLGLARARRAHRPRGRAEDRPARGQGRARGPSARRWRPHGCGTSAACAPTGSSRRLAQRLHRVRVRARADAARRRCAPASWTTRPRSRRRRRSSRGSRTRTRAGSSTATSSRRTSCSPRARASRSRLLDFGLAQMAEEETLTAVGDVPGTLAYISPERLARRGRRPRGRRVGGRRDALGGARRLASVLERLAARDARGGSRPARRRSRRRGPICRSRCCALVDRMLALDPAARPPAAQLAHELRDAFAERLRGAGRRARRCRRCSAPASLAAPAAAALVRRLDGRRAAVLPARFAPLLAVIAGGADARAPAARARLRARGAGAPARQRLVRARGRLRRARRAGGSRFPGETPRQGLFLALGPLLAPFLALGLLPLAAQAMRKPTRRALQVAAAVLLAAVVAGLRHGALPFTGARAAEGLGIAGSERPARRSPSRSWRALQSHPGAPARGGRRSPLPRSRFRTSATAASGGSPASARP